jgi:pyruvate kinase
MRNTKIVATLGPSSTDRQIISGLFDAGVDVFRLNASHGSAEEHRGRVQTVRELAAERGVHIGILMDLQGPKIRLGQFEGGGCELKAGSRFTITTEPVMGNCDRASTGYSAFARDVKPGDRVLLADGAVELRVLSTDGVAAVCEVISGGPVSDRKGINLPGVQVSTPALTKKDMADLRSGIEAGIDMVALSFVRKRDDLLRLRHFLEEHEAHLPIIAKIEKPEGWTRLEEILDEADGVMVARGDLGVEMALEKVPFIQKQIIERARARGRFVITATQMLESMIDNPVPTRAEVSDVANAIYDGTDAVMLSAETSAGKFPVESARMMTRIAREAEASIHPSRRSGMEQWIMGEAPGQTEIMAAAACRIANVSRAVGIVVFTSTGSSARLVSRSRPPMPVFAFTPNAAVARQLSVIYGLHAIEASKHDSTDEMMSIMNRLLVEKKWVAAGDAVVFVAGQPIGIPGTTNMIKLHRISAG